eukprot:TRINITY_DN9169_c0_g1_i2.p1 TRINITY_DN9169_c0_g1~~TRINITY_DN9169_c0_g1_i2.p1  ORF type:complete len:420 (+),score=67.47 TRINITY_DN9169_c0_g1_i2:91-1350(+)
MAKRKQDTVAKLCKVLDNADIEGWSELRELLAYFDVRFQCAKLVDTKLKRLVKLSQKKDVADEEMKEKSIFFYRVISDLEFPADEEDTQKFFWTEEMEKAQQTRSRKRKRRGPTQSVEGFSRYFEGCWSKLLQLPLPLSVIKLVLKTCDTKLLPHFKTPHFLMDFMLQAFNLGGVLSLLSLQSLFILITRHNLDLPDFYTKLYGTLNVDVFYVKYRAKYFNLLHKVFRSTHLPVYLVAAFVKKVARLALCAPPDGCLVAIALVYNLLKLHPSCMVMIDRPIDQREQGGALLLGNPKVAVMQPTSNQGKETPAAPFDPTELDVYPGYDHYNPTELDPSKSNALESSLWEIKSLQKHYLPEVRRIANLIDGRLTKPPFKLSEFTTMSYQSLFLSHLQKNKNTALAFAPPSGLFGDSLNSWA